MHTHLMRTIKAERLKLKRSPVWLVARDWDSSIPIPFTVSACAPIIRRWRSMEKYLCSPVFSMRCCFAGCLWRDCGDMSGDVCCNEPRGSLLPRDSLVVIHLSGPHGHPCYEI